MAIIKFGKRAPHRAVVCPPTREWLNHRRKLKNRIATLESAGWDYDQHIRPLLLEFVPIESLLFVHVSHCAICAVIVEETQR